MAVTVALWTGRRAWLLGATLYLPAAWAHDPARRAQARIPARVVFQEKWRLAVTLLRRVRAAGIHLTAVVGDAEYGDNSTLRQALSRWRLPYALGISGELTLFRGTPTVRPQPHASPPGNRRGGWPDQTPRAARALGGRLRRPAGDPRARLAAAAARARGVALVRAGAGPTRAEQTVPRQPAPTARLPRLVRLAHQRWAIEQQYQDLKDELGFDHFEGRSYPGWAHHAVLSAVAYAFLQKERMQPRPGSPLTFPQVRAITQDVFTGRLVASRPRYLEWMHQAQQRFRQLRM